ncbi:MAG: acyl-CoA dehydrogenase family protein, partial [Rhodospirillaceae bacterium]|nr:acyl-CoA dehydrogenase family protein [Rhodospirillaceae bacterium]
MPNGNGALGGNAYRADRNLQALLRRSAPWLTEGDAERLSSFGGWAATDVDEQADYTNRFAPPVLETLDEDGRPRSVVRHNPLYAAVHREVYERGIVGLNYGAARRPYSLTFAMGYLLAQSDISIHCPVTLTGAVAHVLDRFAPEALRNVYLPRLVRTDGKAATGGTWVTEKQGGSDVGATRTTARRTNDGIRLSGLKWFASNVDGGIALTLARPEGTADGGAGLGLYLVPARGPDGAPNRYRIRRLKDKLGTRGLATGEIELEDAHALEVTPPPDGLRTMMAALGYSRIHNAMASAGIQRRAFAEALSHAETREAFGHRLAAYPMVQDQLVEMQVRLEASVALAFAAAQAFDEAQGTPAEQPWMRLVTALAKYLTAAWAITATSRAIEVLGGNGYTEEYPTARLYRDAQVLTVWEGPPNIQALEVLRLAGADSPGLAAFHAKLDAILNMPFAASHSAFVRPRALIFQARRDVAALTALIRDDRAEAQRQAHRLMDRMAQGLAAALLAAPAGADSGQGVARTWGAAGVAGRAAGEGLGQDGWELGGEGGEPRRVRARKTQHLERLNV